MLSKSGAAPQSSRAWLQPGSLHSCPALEGRLVILYHQGRLLVVLLLRLLFILVKYKQQLVLFHHYSFRLSYIIR